MRLSRCGCRIVCSPCLWEWSGVESNRAPRAAWSPATYQIAMLPLQHRTSCRVGMVGVEPGHRAQHGRSCSQNTRAAVTPHPVVSSQSERPDSLAAISWPPTRLQWPLSYVLVSVARRGVEPRPPPTTAKAAVPEGRHPQPLDERAVLFLVSGSGGARILVSWFSARCRAPTRSVGRLSATDP
jgi:hypothetical protein